MNHLLNRNSIFIFFTFLLLIKCEDVKRTIYLNSESPNKNLLAEIINIEDKSCGNFLTDGTHFLRITNLSDSTKILIEKDLLNGTGGYESGIVKLFWIDNNRIFIERYLDDRKQNLIFNLKEVKFENIGDSTVSIIN